ncbi:hypothetical protein S245_049011, partial [Arachis hypogaea]
DSGELIAYVKISQILEFSSKKKSTTSMWWLETGLIYEVKVFVTHSQNCNIFILHEQDVSFLMKRKCADMLNDESSFDM